MLKSSNKSSALALATTAGVMHLLWPAAAFSQQKDLGNKVQRMFEAAYSEQCEVDQASQKDFAPQTFETTFNYADEDFAPRPYTLFRLHCSFGAYNEMNAYFGADDYGEVRQIQFATPAFSVNYANDDFEDDIESIDLTGFTSVDLLVNSEVDPETLTVVSWSKWRGLGDASSSGTWMFENGQFVLKSFDVDASYDGNINPIRLYGEGEPGYGE